MFGAGITNTKNEYKGNNLFFKIVVIVAFLPFFYGPQSKCCSVIICVQVSGRYCQEIFDHAVAHDSFFQCS